VATGLPAQEKPQFTFGTTVVSAAGIQGRIYHLKENTEKLPRLERMKSVGAIYTKTLNLWPQRFDEGFPGIVRRRQQARRKPKEWETAGRDSRDETGKEPERRAGTKKERCGGAVTPFSPVARRKCSAFL
jgi:hypothetical protein